MRKTARFPLLLALVLIVCSVQVVRAYENAEHGFSINFPSGWEQTQNPDVVVLYSNDDGSASINVIIEETSYSLAEYVAESKNQLEDLDYYELISEDSRTIGGLHGYELVYAWTYFYNDVDYSDLQDKQVFFVENGKAFIITCGSDYSDYDTFLPTFEQSLESFHLTSNETPGTIDSNLIIGVAVIAVIIVLAIGIVLLWRRKRQPAQRQFDDTVTGASYPPPPPPPPP